MLPSERHPQADVIICILNGTGTPQYQRKDSIWTTCSIADALKHAAANRPLRLRPVIRATQTEMLDWMIFNSVQVCHSNDAEFCWVEWSDREGKYATLNFNDARQAIQAAMDGNYREVT